MNVAIASSTKFGSRCWSSQRFLNNCHKCGRYEACTYPERVATPEYDALLTAAREKRAESEALYQQAKELK